LLLYHPSWRVFDFLPSSLDGFHIREDELRIHHFDIVDGIDDSVDMNDVGIFKTAYDVNDRLDFSDVTQKPVAQTFRRGLLLSQDGDIEKRHGRMGPFRRVEHVRQSLEPFIGHGDDADIGIDSTERIVGDLGPAAVKA